MTPARPLAGIQVLDLSAVYAGPICARMLADVGASVIKVEQPGTPGDITRATHRMFAHFNAGKRCIRVDLTAPEGREIVLELMARADVVIENFRPGVVRKLGIDYASVAERFPSLVYCSISGFGQHGPDAQRAAYAPIAHATSGYDAAHMAAQPDPDGRPQNASIMIADILTGSYAFGAIQTALLARHAHGRGDYIDIAMQESMMTLIPGQIQAAQLPDPPRGTGFWPIRAADGYVMVCIVSQKNFEMLAAALERPALLQDERFGRGQRFRHMAEFVGEIEAVTGNWTVAECVQRLNATGVPCARYREPAELFDDPQLQQRKAFTRFDDDKGGFWVQNLPFRFGSVDVSTTPVAAALGEHTDEVLTGDLGRDADAVAALRAAGVVA